MIVLDHMHCAGKGFWGESDQFRVGLLGLEKGRE